MTPQELKNSILQQAIQGKLVEQRPEEGSAEKLYHQIQQEKQRLIAEGKIKKEKPLPEITEDEKPFDIPESWKWVRLGSILHKLTDGTHSTPRYTMNGIPFLSVKNMSSGKLCFSHCKYISEQEHKELYLRCDPQYGDLLLTKVGTTGIPVIVDTDKQFSLFVSVALLKFNQHLIYNKFLQVSINSPLVQIQAAENTKGVGNKNWVMRDIANTIIPFPPIAEQKRIVARIEELLPLLDRYEQSWSRLETFNSRFPDDMKKSLLQYAIQGKLVEQRPEEGTAEELYRQIQQEKQRLIADGKIKKEKPLPEITEEEKPFDIPESWKWVRLKDIVYNRGQMTPQSTFSYIDIGSIDNQRQLLNKNENIIEEKDAPSRARKIVGRGDILYATVRPYLHNVCIIDKDFTYTPIASTGFAVLTCYADIFNKYLFYYLLSPVFDNYANSNENAKGVAYPAINDDRLYRAVIAIPPLAEQKRIVAKLEELLLLCENLIKPGQEKECRV